MTQRFGMGQGAWAAVRRLGTIGLAATLLAATGCGSSSGATCPDPVKGPEGPAAGCPECPPPPRAAGRALEVPREALSLDRPRRVSLVGFSTDGMRALVRAEDASVGSYFQTLDLSVSPSPKVDKTFMFDRASESTVRAQALKGFKLHPGPPSQVDARGVSLLAADRDGQIVVYALSGERAVPIAKLPRLVDADGRASDVSMIKLAWDPTGERVLFIHRQATTADQGFASDWVHVFPVPASSLPF